MKTMQPNPVKTIILVATGMILCSCKARSLFLSYADSIAVSAITMNLDLNNDQSRRLSKYIDEKWVLIRCKYAKEAASDLRVLAQMAPLQIDRNSWQRIERLRKKWMQSIVTDLIPDAFPILQMMEPKNWSALRKNSRERNQKYERALEEMLGEGTNIRLQNMMTRQYERYYGDFDRKTQILIRNYTPRDPKFVQSILDDRSHTQKTTEGFLKSNTNREAFINQVSRWILQPETLRNNHLAQSYLERRKKRINLWIFIHNNMPVKNRSQLKDFIMGIARDLNNIAYNQKECQKYNFFSG